MTAQTRWLRIGCAFEYRAEIETPTVFQVQPTSDRDVRVTGERWSMQPDVPMRHYRDLYGNPCMRVVLPAGQSRLRYQAFAKVPDAAEDVAEDAAEVPPDTLPDHVLLYTLPSRYS